MKLKLAPVSFCVGILLTCSNIDTVSAQSVSDLRAEMDAALCENDWDAALSSADQILAMSTLSDNYREDLGRYRASIVQWRDSGQPLTFEGCNGIDWESAVSGISTGSGNTTARTSTTSTPVYAGTTCSDFASWPEAQFHFHNGSAPPSLDGEGDGLACEYLSNRPREDGNVVRRISAAGMDVEIYRGITDDYYIRFERVNIEDVELPLFTTRSFASEGDARDHYYQFYSRRG